MVTSGVRSKANCERFQRQHSDISFEPYPSDYAILRLNTLPSVGGDTVSHIFLSWFAPLLIQSLVILQLWASGYQAYDRLSKTYQDFLSTLTATHEGTTFKSLGIKFREPRGHPENIGQELTCVTRENQNARTAS